MVFNVFVLSLPPNFIAQNDSRHTTGYFLWCMLEFVEISLGPFLKLLLFQAALSQWSSRRERRTKPCMHEENLWECKSVLRTDLLRTKTPIGIILPYPEKNITNGLGFFFIQVQIFNPKSDACKLWLWPFCFYLIPHMASDYDLREYEQKIRLLENHWSAFTVSDTICLDPAAFSTH